MGLPKHRCSRCGKNKTRDEMSADKTAKSGLRGYCKRCNCSIAQAWYRRNTKAILERKRLHRANNQTQYNARAKAYRRAKRIAVIQAYGGACVCCRENRFEFLAIDHENGGGRKHIISIGGAQRFMDWLIQHDYPKGFRVLCHNCNQALGFYGACPHTLSVPS